MFFTLSGHGSKQDQLYTALKDLILSGSATAGDKLPASRKLAQDAELSRNTVQLVYEQLIAEGFLESRAGAGTFITRDLPKTFSLEENAGPLAETFPQLSRYGLQVKDLPPRPTIAANCDIAFEYGAPDVDSFPWPLWRRLLGRAAQRLSHSEFAGYGDPAGLWDLRKAVAEYLRRNRGFMATPEQILITGGSQQALDLITRVLINPEDTIAMEEPGYAGARLVFETASQNVMGLEVDHDGLATDQLDSLTKPPKLLYVTPSHQFPLGGILPLKRRLELLDWTHAQGSWIIEDDYDSEFRYDHAPIKAMAGLRDQSRVLYMGTLSKALFPALRLGFIAAPAPLVKILSKARWLNDRQSPTLEQLAMANFIEEGHFERHLNRCRKKYTKRRDTLIESLRHWFGSEIDISGTQGGIHLSVWLNTLPPKDRPALEAAFKAQRLGVGFLDRYYRNPPQRLGILLGFSTLSPEEISEGIQRLHAAVQKVRNA